MTKIRKIGADGKMHDYWQYTEAEVAKMKEEAAKKKQQQEAQADGDLQETSA